MRTLSRRACSLLVLFFGAATVFAAGIEAESGLTRFDGCVWVEADWADGDSFAVRFPDGTQRTVRLYGADCIESRVATESDARRLRDQRRYFGLGGRTAEESIATARGFGEAAAARARELLARPFTVYTAFADGRGDSRFGRIYGFVVTADGEDLASVLVREGLARAFGVSRQGPRGVSAQEYRERLKDLELAAAGSRAGVWGATDWERLAEDRRALREEEAELAIGRERAAPPPGSIDPNAATEEELTALPGVGPALARRIIAARADGAFRSADDLRRVPGIGPAMVERLRSYLRFNG